MVVKLVHMNVTHHKLCTMKMSIVSILLMGALAFISCEASDDVSIASEYENNGTKSEWKCGTHNGKTLYTGPKGGCYYYNGNGNKTYVDRSECSCL
jgi:hypothetical protein